MSTKKNIVNGKKIQNYIRRKICWFLLIILGVGFASIVFAVIMDLNIECKKNIYGKIAMIVRHFSGDDLVLYVQNVKHIIAEHIREFYDSLITIDTILAAAVIFFYSVQDNKKEGIPHRSILAYTFGSFAIPVFFILTMILLPINFWFSYFGMNVTVVICTLLTYVFQLTIIILILLSTSYRYSLFAIRNAEIRQYKKLCEMEKERSDNHQKLESNPQFVWTYLMHHLEQVVVSDELIADKMMLIRILLGTPYYENRISLWKVRRLLKIDDDYVQDMEKGCLEKNSLRKIYEFYYGNFSAVMQYLGKPENSIERNKVYMVLYEFLEELHKLYQKTNKDSKTMSNYLMTISGIMSAVLDNDIKDAEGFCNYVLNECIKDEEIREKQMGLYFLFQEYLYRISIDNRSAIDVIHLNQLSELRNIEKWKMVQEDEELYYEFWLIWMEWTTLSFYNRNRYFYNAISALRGEDYNSGPVSYIMLSIKYMGRGIDEDKNYSVNK